MGIEPITYHLQGDCSTVELHRQTLPFKVQNVIRLHDYTKASSVTQGFFGLIQMQCDLKVYPIKGERSR